jgi:hypothetical protein
VTAPGTFKICVGALGEPKAPTEPAPRWKPIAFPVALTDNGSPTLSLYTQRGVTAAPAACGSDFSFYNTLVIAYPHQTGPFPGNTTYKGMPANQYEDEPRC